MAHKTTGKTNVKTTEIKESEMTKANKTEKPASEAATQATKVDEVKGMAVAQAENDTPDELEPILGKPIKTITADEVEGKDSDVVDEQEPGDNSLAKDPITEQAPPQVENEAGNKPEEQAATVSSSAEAIGDEVKQKSKSSRTINVTPSSRNGSVTDDSEQSKVAAHSVSLVRGAKGLFNRDQVAGIHIYNSGVGVLDATGDMIYWHEEYDRQKKEQIAVALSDAVVDGTAIDWKALGY